MKWKQMRFGCFKSFGWFTTFLLLLTIMKIGSSFCPESFGKWPQATFNDPITWRTVTFSWEITRGIIFCVIIPTRALLNKIFSDGKLLCELLDVLIPRCFAKNGIRFHKSEQALRHSEYQCSGRFSNWNISHHLKKNLENIVVKPASIWNSFSENINWFLDILNKEFKIRWDY